MTDEPIALADIILSKEVPSALLANNINEQGNIIIEVQHASDVIIVMMRDAPLFPASFFKRWMIFIRLTLVARRAWQGAYSHQSKDRWSR